MTPDSDTGDGAPDIGDDTMELLALIASYTLEDIEDVKGRRKGKSSEGPLTDAELALELFAQEARSLQILAGDMVLAHSIDQALHADSAMLEEYARIEEMERRDREIARAINFGKTRPPPTATVGPSSSSTLARRLPSSKLSASSTTMLSPAVTSNAIASSSATGKLLDRKKVPAVHCVICRDEINGPIIYAPCNDAYDVECLVDLFRAATVDESLFPPSCCRQPFELTKVRQYFTKELAALFDKKAIEFGTKNRVYCHQPACSAFLGAATPHASNLSCTECWKYTCGHCKAAAHPFILHCVSEEDSSVIALAEREGWKRCPGCGHLVELSFGCYHMTCRCRYQFCYLCSARWKSCTCLQWDENRLLNAAQDRVARRQRAQGAAVVPPERYRQIVAREAENLRENHECVAHRWRYVPEAGHCEGCGHFLRIFLFHCNRCYTRMCARCKNNRMFAW